MPTFLSVPPKRGNEIEIIKPLRKYITDSYGEEQATAHAKSLEDLQVLRNKMLSKLFDKHESTISLITQYYDQLWALESKIPITENEVRIDFKWKNAFGGSSLKIASSGYERMCILFNLASVYSQVAQSQNMNDAPGLRLAVKYFQMAAGIFTYLRNMVTAIIQREPSSDMNSDSLSALTALMLAQAQELIFTKAARDNMKASNIAKIVQQDADLYADALKIMQLPSIKSQWPRDWINIVAGKQACFHALAEYYQSKACADAGTHGEQIARLKKASELMTVAAKRAGSSFEHGAEQSRIKTDLEQAIKENNMIYHATVPDTNGLSSVPKACVAKEIELGTAPYSTDFKDLFARLVPMAIHNAMIMFDSQKKGLANSEIFRIREANETLAGIMASLNLPGCVEDTQGSDEVPPSLLEKAAQLREKGGVASIEEMLNNLPDLLGRNKDILNEAVRLLNDEAESDTNMRNQFKDKWTRTPSVKLTEAWRGESDKFQQILTQANQSDDIVRKRYQDHRQGIELLSKSDSEIKAALPKNDSSTGDSGASGSVKQDLRKLCSDVDKLKNDRQALEERINQLEIASIASRFQSALNTDGTIDNQESINGEELNRAFEPIRQEIRDSLDKQESLLQSIQNKHSNLVSAGGQGQASSNRAALLNSMVAAFDQFHNLKSNLNEGSKFYTDLTEILLKFQNKVNDFYFARKIEKDDLMKDVQSNIVSQRTEVPSSAGASAASTYQATSSGTEASAPVPPQPNPTAAPGRPPVTYNQPQQQQPPAQAAAQAPPANPAGYSGQQQQPQQQGYYPGQPQYGQYPAGMFNGMPQPGPAMPYPVAPYGMPTPMPNQYGQQAAYGQQPYGQQPNYGQPMQQYGQQSYQPGAPQGGYQYPAQQQWQGPPR